MQLISVRIPKTGSSTFGAYLMAYYGAQGEAPLQPFEVHDPNCLLYRDRELGKHAFQRDYAPFLVKQDYSHLHIPVWCWEGLFPEAKRVCFMRHPVSQIISGYFFARKLGHIPQHMGIWEYLEIPERQNWQSWFMGEDIRNFNYIGFQETFSEDLFRLFEDLLKSKLLLPPDQAALNENLDPAYARVRKDLLKDKMFLRRLRKLNRKDFDLYEEAWNLWKQTPLKITWWSSPQFVRSTTNT